MTLTLNITLTIYLINNDQLRLSYEDDDTALPFSFTFNRVAD